jgi:glycosyltransferase involved in cell wall biosynthesis
VFKKRNELTPRISVVIPLYNHAGYIGEALESVLAQTVAPSEIIVVDDGSTDNSLAIAESMAARDSRLIVWSQPNQDAPQAINAGLHRATGEFVAILNSDDAYSPKRLERCIGALQRDAAAGCVATGLAFMDASGAPQSLPWHAEALAFRAQEPDTALALINANFVMTTSNFFLRRSALREVGYFSRLRYAHDLDFLVRLLLAGQRLVTLDEPLVRYRLHPSNTIKERHDRVRIEWAAVAAFFAHKAANGMHGGSTPWETLRRLTAITERHQLTRDLAHFLTFFARSEPSRADAFLDDPAFLAFVIGAGR